MRKARPALGAALIILASFLALSCNNSYGIFQSVQAEKAQNGSTTFQETTAYTAFRLNTNYYAKTARLYRRDVSDGSPWSQVMIGGSNSYFLRSVVLAGSTIYALVGDDSSSVALYSSLDGTNWTKITTLPTSSVVPHASSTYAFDALFATSDGQLYIEGHAFIPNPSTSFAGTSYYDLYHYNGAGFDPVTNFYDLSTTIRGVVYDSSSYWFASENLLYSSTAVDNSSSPVPQIGNFTNLSTNLIWNIAYTGGNLYISTQNGYLYQGPGSGTALNTSLLLSDVVSPYAGLILVGTDTKDINNAAVGYYEGTYPSLVLGSSSSIVSSTSSIYNTTVGSFPVHSFFWDGTSNNLFVCISPGSSNSSFYGLYMSHWNGSSWNGWSAQ
jgi:hypothetical protein